MISSLSELSHPTIHTKPLILPRLPYPSPPFPCAGTSLMLRSGGRVGGVGNHRHRRHHHHDHHPYPLLPPPLPPPSLTLFHLLQLTIISAQDLQPTCSKTRAYGQAWVYPEYKLQTRIDRIGGTNPNWNDKFIFRVDSDFLRSDTAAVTIDIKRASLIGLRPDPIIGTARLVLSAVNTSPVTQFVAVQVRRPKSLRPQGILNLGVALCSEIEAEKEILIRRSTSSRRRWEGSGRGTVARELKKSGEVGRRMADKERKALQLKLENWRTEIPPAVVDPPQGKPERKEEAEERPFGCFYGGRRRKLMCFIMISCFVVHFSLSPKIISQVSIAMGGFYETAAEACAGSGWAPLNDLLI